MTKNKNIQKEYNSYCSIYQLAIPCDVGILISPDDSVRLLSQKLEELDYTHLLMAYSRQGRNPEVSPINLFKILVYAYMNNIYSSRKIEKACKRDINFMWLLEGKRAPDHNTISRFRSQRLAGIIDDLFSQLVVKLSELDEVKFQNIFIDGTKIESSANKYTFVWKKSTNKFEAKLKDKVDVFLNELNGYFENNFKLSENKVEVSQLRLILNFLNVKKNEEKIVFVYGKGKRKSKIQKFIETIEAFIEKQTKYDEYNFIFNGRNSFSKTDKDATFMHMKEDHMRNSQLKPGYNIQIGVEGEYIVGLDISSERSDQLTLIPFMHKLENNLPEKFKNIIADAGYESEENYQYLEDNCYVSYIKPSNYEKSKSSKYKNNIGKRENMKYDSTHDEYTCANNIKLKPIGITKRKSKSGYISEITIYESESCENCNLSEKCTKAKGNKKITVSKEFIKKREISLKNIKSETGIILRMNRSIQVEGAFGVLKADYGFRRFLTKGFKNVKAEMTLLCFAYNINKLHNKIQNNRLKSLLFKCEVA